MKKRFKSKKRLKHKSKFFLLLIAIAILFINNYKIPTININNKVLKFILNSSNYYTYNNKSNKFINSFYYLVNNDIFNSPENILKSQIMYTKNSSNTNNTISVNFNYAKNDPVDVYIYNSHQGENYSKEYLEDYNITPDVLMASHMLKEKLNNLNINAFVEESDILAYMKEQGLNHAGSYIASRVFLKEAYKKNKSAKLFIDLHRDAASKEATYVNINGKDCAKVLFVIGLEYDTYKENLEIVTKINNIILNKYPTLTRGIMKKEGYGVNGVYNQDIGPNVILIEVGGNNNNIDEVNNTLDLIADVIGEYINETR